jgi:hypothetical protein
VAEPAVSVTVLPAPETVLPTVSVRPPRAPFCSSNQLVVYIARVTEIEGRRVVYLCCQTLLIKVEDVEVSVRVLVNWYW